MAKMLEINDDNRRLLARVQRGVVVALNGDVDHPRIVLKRDSGKLYTEAYTGEAIHSRAGARRRNDLETVYDYERADQSKVRDVTHIRVHDRPRRRRRSW